MNALRATLRRAARDLRDLDRDCALAGGFAVSARTEPRTTRDIDLIVAVRDDAEAERLVADLVARGYRIVTAIEQTAVGRLATVRLLADTGVIVDLLFASSGVESEVVAGAEVLEIIRGVRLAVPVLSHLIALKVLSRDDKTRPQDRVDLAALLSRATDDDLAEARALLQLITTRGYHRDIDLLAALDRARVEFG